MTKTSTEARMEQLIDQAYHSFVYGQGLPEQLWDQLMNTLLGKRVFFTWDAGCVRIVNERLSKVHPGLFTSTPSTMSGVIYVTVGGSVTCYVFSGLLMIRMNIVVEDVRDEREASEASDGAFDKSEFVSDAEFNALADTIETFVNGTKPYEHAIDGLNALLTSDDSPVFYCHGTCFERDGFLSQVFDFIHKKYDERVVA